MIKLCICKIMNFDEKQYKTNAVQILISDDSQALLNLIIEKSRIDSIKWTCMKEILKIKKWIPSLEFDLSCDSWWSFEFSWLNSLFSWTFTQQGKKVKLNRITNGSVTFKQYLSYHNTFNTELCILCSFFLYWFSQYCSQ